MAIGFPNQSRSFDTSRHAVRFWGSEGALEASFFVSREALLLLQPELSELEADCLRAFDAHRDRIYSVAAKVYGRGRKGVYELRAHDF